MGLHLTGSSLTQLNNAFVGKAAVPLNVKDFGAVGNGTTNDAAAIQSAITAAQGTKSVGAPGATIYFPPGEYKINSTIVLDRFAGQLLGAGQGQSPAYTATPGSGTVLRWGGAADSPMVKVTDSQSVRIAQMRLEGLDTAVPSYGIQFDNPGGTNGTNQYLIVEDVWIGRFPWATQGTNKGLVDVGIGFTGTNANNDQFYINRVVLSRCVTAGVSLPNTQSTWGSIRDSTFDGCATGLTTSASVTLNNPQFAGSTVVDMAINSTARVVVTALQSESSAKVATIATSGSLTVHGGHLHFASPMTSGGNWLSHASLVGGINVTLVGITAVNGLATHPKLYARATGGAGVGNAGGLNVIGCGSLGSIANLDVAAGASDALNVFIRSASETIDHLITNMTLAAGWNAGWTSWTPTLGGTGATVGNGTVTGGYTQVGKTIHYWAQVTLGSTSAVSTSGPTTVSLPVQAKSAASGHHMVLSERTGSNEYRLEGFPGVNNLSLYTPGTGGAYGPAVTTTAPWTWGANDWIRWSGTYEAA